MYKLTKTQKGQFFIYEVTDERGNVISTRRSKREYVACTIDGSFYFGRLDLINKGDHLKTTRHIQGTLNDLPGRYKSYKKYGGELTYYEFKLSETETLLNRLAIITTIAYL